MLQAELTSADRILRPTQISIKESYTKKPAVSTGLRSRAVVQTRNKASHPAAKSFSREFLNLMLIVHVMYIHKSTPCRADHVRQTTEDEMLDTTLFRSQDHILTGFNLMLHFFILLQDFSHMGLGSHGKHAICTRKGDLEGISVVRVACNEGKAVVACLVVG